VFFEYDPCLHDSVLCFDRVLVLRIQPVAEEDLMTTTTTTTDDADLLMTHISKLRERRARRSIRRKKGWNLEETKSAGRRKLCGNEEG
jgi:hypothetical protein